MRPTPRRASMVLSGAGVILLGAFILFKIASTGHALPDPDDAGSPTPPREVLTPRRVESAPRPASADLLDRVDLDQDAISGPWGFYHRALFTDGLAWGRTQLPCEPPEEYDFRVRVTRKQGNDSFSVGFVWRGRRGCVTIDGFGSTCSWIGLTRPGGDLRFNETRAEGRRLRADFPSDVLVSVRRAGVKVFVDGMPLTSWSGDPDELEIESGFRVPNPRALFLGSWMTVFRVDHALLTPVTGTPVFLR